MTERPILFNGAMVRALLDGSKTQTRRVVKELPGGRGGPVGDHVKWWEPGTEDPARWCGHDGLGSLGWLKCPYGVPGDRLWVRETWAPVDSMIAGHELEDAHCVGYRSTESARYCWHDAEQTEAEVYGWDWGMVKWKPSIFMPRFASRLTLEVTDVRVERVADISPEDAKAEGAAYRITPGGDLSGVFEGCGPINYPAHFRDLWDSINGSTPGRSWDDNPWVWIVDFKRVTP